MEMRFRDGDCGGGNYASSLTILEQSRIGFARYENGDWPVYRGRVTLTNFVT